MFFLGTLSIQRKIKRDRPAEPQRSTGRSRSTCWPPLAYTIVCAVETLSMTVAKSFLSEVVSAWIIILFFVTYDITPQISQSNWEFFEWKCSKKSIILKFWQFPWHWKNIGKITLFCFLSEIVKIFIPFNGMYKFLF